jgi:hypothetical protein
MNNERGQSIVEWLILLVVIAFVFLSTSKCSTRPPKDKCKFQCAVGKEVPDCPYVCEGEE